MRTLRAVVLAIVATLALAGGIASTADARGGPPKVSTAVVDGADGPSTDTDAIDPGDPGLPPDQ